MSEFVKKKLFRLVQRNDEKSWLFVELEWRDFSFSWIGEKSSVGTGIVEASSSSKGTS